jgi:hypothetical protein
MRESTVVNDPLSVIGERCGTDKVRDHHYTPHYHRRFKSLRDEPITLLEIGIGGYDDPLAGGESLRMWREYFTKATIVGLDIAMKAPIEGCHVEQGDQSDPRVLHHLGETYGPFDIIIDDGSHRMDDIQQSWVILWGYLNDGGWYCVEDLQTAYWPNYGGSSVRTGETTIGFLQGLIDRIHYAEFDIPNYSPNRFDETVVGLEIVRNLAFILKGDNRDPSLWMPPHPHGKVFE